MNYSITFTAEAIQDLQAGFDWYEEKRVGLGHDFLLSIGATNQMISRTPLIFQAISKKNSHLRRAVVPRFNYLVFFGIKKDVIIIFAVLNSRQNPAIWKDRMKNV